MKHVVSFSGGRTSAYLVHLMEQKRINEGWDVEYVFMDTGAEHPKTYEFIRNVVEHFKINLRCIRTVITQKKGVGASYKEVGIDGIGWDLSMWKDMMQKFGNPYVNGGFCTTQLKTIPHDKFCNDEFGRGKYLTWLGIRIDEKRRLKARENVRYLAEISQANKNQILGWWEQMPFDLEIDEWLGNCVYCFKKGTNKVAVSAIQEPNLAEQWLKMTTNSSVLQKFEPDGTPIQRGAIYRGKLTLDGVAKFYEGESAEDIIQTMRYRRGCAIEKGESCEVFGCQMDLFDGEAA